MRQHFECELAILRDIGDSFGEQRAWGNLGRVHLDLHRPERAAEYLRQQITLAREFGAEVGEAYGLIPLVRHTASLAAPKRPSTR